MNPPLDPILSPVKKKPSVFARIMAWLKSKPHTPMMDPELEAVILTVVFSLRDSKSTHNLTVDRDPPINLAGRILYADLIASNILSWHARRHVMPSIIQFCGVSYDSVAVVAVSITCSHQLSHREVIVIHSNSGEVIH